MKNTKSEDCAFKCERSLQDLLCSLEGSFKKHLELLKSDLDEQIKVIESMWDLSQRFLFLTRSAICVRPYPREQSVREEREIRARFEAKKHELSNSNCKLAASLEVLRQKCNSFDMVLQDTIDQSLPSQIIEGNSDRKPIHYYIEFFADFFKFFQDIQLRLFKTTLRVDDIKSISEYKHNLQPNKTELDYFEESLNKYQK